MLVFWSSPNLSLKIFLNILIQYKPRLKLYLAIYENSNVDVISALMYWDILEEDAKSYIFMLAWQNEKGVATSLRKLCYEIVIRLY